MTNDGYAVRLSADEALVLYDFAHRLILDQDADHHPGLFLNRGEWHALSALLARLETQLPDMFMPDCIERLEAARGRLQPSDND